MTIELPDGRRPDNVQPTRDGTGIATTGKGYPTMGGKTCAVYAMCAACPDCGRQVDSHAGHIDNGRVPACGKGRPHMREAGHHRRHCGPTAISPEKCEPKAVGHD